MHELGIVFHMIDTLEMVASDNELATIAVVRLNLGEVSGVLPDYLIDCWNWAVKRTEVLHDAQLEIHQIDAVTLCHACGKAYPTMQFGKTCPHCESTDTVLLQGTEIEIDTIEGA